MHLGKVCLMVCVVLLISCSERVGLAPVVESNWHIGGPMPVYHRVTRGQTLYAIAFRHDLDYRQLAELNHIPPPYTVRIGQVLILRSSKRSSSYHPVSSKPLPHIAAVRLPVVLQRAKTPPQRKGWVWPATGRVIAGFLPQKGQKGIDIAGRRGDRIRAAAGGIVAYAGNGLAGYGNLIIIKHNNQYLTAYGNNLRNLVREGQPVRAGQVIAEMGQINRQYWGVHFEIRQAGKPINPMNYL